MAYQKQLEQLNEKYQELLNANLDFYFGVVGLDYTLREFLPEPFENDEESDFDEDEDADKEKAKKKKKKKHDSDDIDTSSDDEDDGALHHSVLAHQLHLLAADNGADLPCNAANHLGCGVSPSIL